MGLWGFGALVLLDGRIRNVNGYDDATLERHSTPRAGGRLTDLRAGLSSGQVAAHVHHRYELGVLYLVLMVRVKLDQTSLAFCQAGTGIRATQELDQYFHRLKLRGSARLD